MYLSCVITISVQRPLAVVYDYMRHPENFVQWASGLENLHNDQGVWKTITPQGEMEIRFSPENAFGIIDHVVITPDRTEIYMPVRVIANGASTDVQLTLFHTPEMTEETFQRDSKWIEKDLHTLKHLLENTSS